jgi:GT2 family glycosyltransferase
LIHIIIPVHNRLALTKKCIESLDNQSYKNWNLYILDDGSSDGTSNWINKINRNDIKLMHGNGNLWWTGSIHKAVSNIIKIADKDDYIMTVNNDITFFLDTIEKLILSMKKYPKSICSSITLSKQGHDLIAISSGAIIKSWFFNLSSNPLYSKKYNLINKNNNIKVDMLTGRSVIYPSSVFRKNSFDYKTFPHYGGDSEFTNRLKRKGYDLFIIPSSRILVDQEQTGLNPLDKKLTITELFKSFFSIRSTNNLFTKFKFSFKVPPWYARPTYFLISVAKVLIISSIGNLLVKKKL